MIIRATVDYKADCRCGTCGASKLSSVTNKIDTGVVDSVDGMMILIQNEMDHRFVQPPVGWVVNGRGNFQCDSCMQKAADDV